MTEQVKEDAVQTFEKVYSAQVQKCSVAAWNLAIYLSENETDLSSLPEPVRESLVYMLNCRRIVHAQTYIKPPVATESLDLTEDTQAGV